MCVQPTSSRIAVFSRLTVCMSREVTSDAGRGTRRIWPMPRPWHPGLVRFQALRRAFLGLPDHRCAGRGEHLCDLISLRDQNLTIPYWMHRQRMWSGYGVDRREVPDELQSAERAFQLPPVVFGT